MSFKDELRNKVRAELQGVAKEMGFAVNDIRQKVVEKPWFGKEVTPEIVNGVETKSQNTQEPTQEASRDEIYGKDVEADSSREDVYGQDPFDIDPELEDGREHLNNDYERERDIDIDR